MPSIREQLQHDLIASMKARESEKVAVYRLIFSEIKQREIDNLKKELEEQEVIAVIQKMQKQRQESINHFKTANRQDLVEKEEFEMQILKQYLPIPASEQEIADLITETINKIKNSNTQVSMKNMGEIIKILRPKLIGRADMSIVANKVKSSLS